MGILDDIKSQAQNSGSAFKKTFYAKDGDSKRVRFLIDFEDGIKVPWLDCYARNINCPNPEYFNKTNPWEDDPDVKQTYMYMWQVYDYDAGETKLFLYKISQCTPIPHLNAIYKTHGTLLDRDINISCIGAQTNKTMPCVSLEKSKFRQRAKLLSNKAVNDILSEMYKRDLQGSDDAPEDKYEGKTEVQLYNMCKERDIECKTRQDKAYYVDLLETYEEDNAADNTGFMNDPEPEEDDGWDEELADFDYANMKPIELYKECGNRGIKVKPKQKAPYYIKFLKKYDEEHKEVWDEEEPEEDDGWGEVEEDDDSGLPWN